MKTTEELQTFRGLTPAQISAKITDSRKKLSSLRQDKVLGKIKNVHEITQIRKSIARLQTILDEKIAAAVK